MRQSRHLDALNGGYQAAFLVGAACAALAALLSACWLRPVPAEPASPAATQSAAPATAPAAEPALTSAAGGDL